MPESQCPCRGYKGMWLFVLFDLPMRQKEKRLTLFRKELIGKDSLSFNSLFMGDILNVLILRTGKPN